MTSQTATQVMVLPSRHWRGQLPLLEKLKATPRSVARYVPSP